MSKKLEVSKINLAAIHNNANKAATKYFPWRIHQQRMLPRNKIGPTQVARK